MFHSRAHMAALSACNIQKGARVLEVATGSGEMLESLVRANFEGQTVAVDVAPKMVALSHTNVRTRFPKGKIDCQAADGRHLPFKTGIFDIVVCCFFFERLPEVDVPKSLAELSRVLRPGGRLVITLAGQDKASFNALYKACSKLAARLLGPAKKRAGASLLQAQGYTIDS
jgi:ubiquinone/menaquinone biosynthesis C-methylase UbiE